VIRRPGARPDGCPLSVDAVGVCPWCRAALVRPPARRRSWSTHEIGRMDAVTIARHVAAKELSPVEVVDVVLDRLDRLDPVLNAFTTVVPEEARQRAKRLEAEIAAGNDVGPLAGVPTGVKDLICTRGCARRPGRSPTPTSYPTRTTSWSIGSRPPARSSSGRPRCPGSATRAPGRPAGRADSQPVEPRPHVRRLLGRQRGRGRHRNRPVLPRQRRRWLGAHPGQLLRALRAQGDDGPGAALPGDQGRALSGRVQLGVPGAHRPADPHRRRRRAGDVRDRRA
jgi:hypothetical protein